MSIGSFRGHGVISKFLKDRSGHYLDIGFIFPGRYKNSTLVYFDTYENGELLSTQRRGGRFAPVWLALQRVNPNLLHLPILLLVVQELAKRKQKFDTLFMASNSPAALFMKLAHAGRHTILFSDDLFFVEGSLPSKVLQVVLLGSERFLHNTSNEAWYTTERLLRAKLNQHIITNPSVKRKIVPHGATLDWYRWKATRKYERNTVVYFGAIVPGRGLEMTISAMALVTSVQPNSKLRIVGEDVPRFTERLRSLTKSLGLEDSVTFVTGGSESADNLKDVATCAVGIAIYDETQRSILYTDSSKIKKYIGCGMPVVVSKRLAFSREIEDWGAGISVENTIEAIAHALVSVLGNDELLDEQSVNAVRLAQRYDYEQIYSNAFGCRNSAK